MLNELQCSISGGNTGYGDCFLDIKALAGAIMVPSNRLYTPTETASAASFIAALSADAASDDISLRARPLGRVFNFTDGSEDVTIQTGSLGDKVITREGDYDWTYQFIDGGFCLLKALRQFNGQRRSFIFYDVNGVLYGTKVGANMKGIPALYYSSPFKIADGTNGTIYNSRFIFKPYYLNDNIGFVQANLVDIETIQGLQDVAIQLVSRATNVIKVKLKTGCGSQDLYSLYSAELAAPANWVAKTTGGAVLDITSVAIDTNVLGWTITLDATDTDYAVGVDVNLSLAATSVLALAGVVGFESNTLLIP